MHYRHGEWEHAGAHISGVPNKTGTRGAPFEGMISAAPGKGGGLFKF